MGAVFGETRGAILRQKGPMRFAAAWCPAPRTAEHIAHLERWVEVTGPYATVREWSVLPTKPDNHWLDCLVGCAVAASMLDVRAAGQDAKPLRQRKRYTQADLRRP